MNQPNQEKPHNPGLLVQLFLKEKPVDLNMVTSFLEAHYPDKTVVVEYVPRTSP